MDIQQVSVFAVLAGVQSVVLAFQVYISMRYLDAKEAQKKKDLKQSETIKRLSRGGGPK